MELTVLERLSLLGIIPVEADFTTIKIVRKMRESLSFSEEELALLNFKEGDKGQVTWTDDAVEEKEFEFGKAALRVIEDSLKQLSDQKKLSVDHITLYEKFVDSEE